MKTYNNGQIHQKIMLEFPSGTRRWGYVSTMHSQSVHGVPVIVWGDAAYLPDDIIAAEIIIICNDTETIDLLKQSGYMSLSCTADKIKKIGISLPMALYEKIKEDADENNTSANAEMVKILKSHYNEP